MKRTVEIEGDTYEVSADFGWAAQDEDGVWFVSVEEPHTGGHTWDVFDGCADIVRGDPNPHWRLTKQRLSGSHTILKSKVIISSKAVSYKDLKPFDIFTARTAKYMKVSDDMCISMTNSKLTSLSPKTSVFWHGNVKNSMRNLRDILCRK